MNNKVKRFAQKFINKLPLKNIIIFESHPDYSDNTKAVFDEMIKRGVNKDYKLVWVTHYNPELPYEYKALKNVSSCSISGNKYKYYCLFSKAFISCNYFLNRKRKEQYYIYLAHGSALKAIKDNRISIPESVYGCDYVVISELLGKYEAMFYNCDVNNINILTYGYPRNDVLFKSSENDAPIFGDYNYSKIIYWLPTFRQKKYDRISYSDISVPFIYNSEIAKKINHAAKKNDILIVLKPHPAQDVSNIKIDNMSNIVLIDNDYLIENNISNYDLLRRSDALLSDYSSVVYDYYLCDKPVGLCWEDYEQYDKNEGIVKEVLPFLEGCKKLYKYEELIDFINSVGEGRDDLKEIRNKNKSEVHKYCDINSCERIVNHILYKLQEL